MDIQKKKVPKDKAWSVATKTAALTALGLIAGLGLGACSKEEPEPIIFGDVGTDLTVSMQVKSPDSTKADSICVRDSVKTDSAVSTIEQKLSKMKDKGTPAPIAGMPSARSIKIKRAKVDSSIELSPTPSSASSLLKALREGRHVPDATRGVPSGPDGDND
ncbi:MULTISPECIES: hypothetical protein [unclassified Fibrobacter]|uniref:hypothetical protein n=1 Tax=unclassified Fibrobacter TaxID=2634177 RepID=UPI000D6BA1A2|nr:MULTISPECIES: hypothetical protein [unclassified Fibrobacter]PWJ70018.1 hypothetical protein BGX12_10498 [Fibrobacter sp. UWR4]PZW73189.1 hypothetical protein C8E88_100498 [Fibrobacter sp. UWR1]